MAQQDVRELTVTELDAVSGGVTVNPHIFDKLFASIDKSLATLKDLKPGGYLPPG